MSERVVVAGAGPTGLVTALCLAEHGIPVIVLEAEPALPENLRASTFHPPTLDMLDRFDATERLIAMGLVAPRFQYRTRHGGCFAEFDFEVLRDETRHPYRVQCEQYKLNAVLLERLTRSATADIRFKTSLIGVEAQGECPVAVVQQGGRTERIDARYVVGAEGARSVVREAMGIAFEGFTWPERFLVASTPFPFEEHFKDLTQVNYIADPDEWFFLLRVSDMWRTMIPTRAEESDEAVLSDEQVQRRLNRIVPMAAPYPVTHRTLYRVHQRVAAAYRKGPCFLVGDAAHINNPLGGMGMNGGVHDAFNLAEKLTAVWHGEKDETYLDLYERQRRPVALEYVNTITIRNKRNLEARDPDEQRRFQDSMRAAAADPEKARAYLRQVSMIASLEKAASVS
ncbi:MAG TPA: NAD(P)/FAD-dependent oxidoreductase [Alphaproteobacteria bacterium]